MSEGSKEPGGAEAKKPGGNNIALWLMVLFLAGMAGALGVWSIGNGRARLGFGTGAALPILGVVPPFSLIERGEDRVDLEMLHGRIWIADFIFTRCGGACPLMTERMGVLQKTLKGIPEIWPPAQLVSFSVDPEWDTPEVLRQYAERYGAEEKRWFFLTGSYEEIQRLAQDGFHLGVERTGSDEGEPVIHSQKFTLVDPQGRIRGYYDATEPEELHRLLADVARLGRSEMRKKRSGREPGAQR